MVDEEVYEGCLRVRLIPDENKEEAIDLDLAPKIGEIRREVYEDGIKVRVRELVMFRQESLEGDE